jgi:DTW domain-containing protein YfiP
MSDYKSPAAIRDELAQALQAIPPAERESFAAQHLFKIRSQQFGIVLCGLCWLSIPECICRSANPISSFPHRLVVIVHPEEFARSSNTGALPQVCMLPQNITVLVRGVPEHDAEIASLCKEPYTFVLFPGQGARTFAEFVKSVTPQSQTEQSQTDPCEITYNIIIVDGTWTQAKKLERSIPLDVPRICLASLESLPEELKRPMREHSDSSKVCTLAATIQLLSEMRCEPSVIESLSELLALKTAVICKGKQKRRKE